MPKSKELDAVVLCVAHKEYVSFDLSDWLDDPSVVILDASNVLSLSIRNKLRGTGAIVESIGRGSGM